MWSIGGEGQADSWYIQGWVDDLIKVEKVFAPRLKEKYGFLAPPLFVGSMKPGTVHIFAISRVVTVWMTTR